MQTSRMLRTVLAISLALQLAACTSSQRAPHATVQTAVLDPTTPAAQLFAKLEERLLEAPTLHLRYTATSEGAFNASLTGTLGLFPDGRVELEGAGSFGDSLVTLNLRSDAQEMEGGAPQRTFREPTPPALREALILGLTRMGVLHNLARLTAGRPPDHAAGGVREWVEVHELQQSTAAASDPGLLALTFAVHVSDTRAAQATLWLDQATGFPVRREQVVSFPGGSMRVTELYEFSP